MNKICCGASKIGAVTTVNLDNIVIHHVPVLYCPVCKDIKPHPKIKDNLNLIVDIAKDDGLKEIDLNYYLNWINYEELFEVCSTVDNGDWHDVVQSQVDISLDLLSFARLIKDTQWEEDLKQRLSVLSKHRDVTNHR